MANLSKPNMTRTISKQKTDGSLPSLCLAACLLSIVFSGCGLAQVPSDKQQGKKPTPHEYRPFSFDFSNVTNDMVFASRIKVLNRGMGLRTVWPNKQAGRGGIGHTRNDCTPDALLETRAEFEWRKIKDRHNRKPPKDPKQIFNSFTLFPNFDTEAESWSCLFTLHEDRKWVGRFEGAVLKPMGDRPKSWKKSQLEGDNQWIQFQFRNLTERDIYVVRRAGNLVHNDSEIELQIPSIPADENFYGVTAQSHSGSIYRPLKGDRMVLSWSIHANVLGPDDPIIQHKQWINLPEFDPNIEDWFCYFTLEPDNKWTAKFEGVKEPEKDVEGSGASK